MERYRFLPLSFLHLWSENLFIGHIKQMTVFSEKLEHPPSKKGTNIFGKTKKSDLPTGISFLHPVDRNAFLLKGGLKRPFDGGLKLHNTEISETLINKKSV